MRSPQVYCFAYSPDGKALATASSDKSARLWDTAAGTSERLGRRSCVVSSSDSDEPSLGSGTAGFSSDGKVIAVASGDKTVKL
eukprot:m51a1_g6154 putative wd-40 repeat-containing protein (83) ;mRNA; r:310974-311264